MLEPTFRIETERLVLRPFREEDAGEVFELFRDPEVFRYTPDTPYASVQTAREFISEAMHLYGDPYRRDGRGPFRYFLAPTRREDGRVLGLCGVGGVEYDRMQNEVFYILGRPHWGLGYATEAAAAVLRWAFDGLALPRVIGIVQPANLASARVLEKIGLQRTGLLQGLPEEFRYHEGEFLYELERGAYLDP